MSKKRELKLKEGSIAVYDDNYGFWARQGDPILPGSTVRVLSLMQPFGCAGQDYATVQDTGGNTMFVRTVDLREDTSND